MQGLAQSPLFQSLPAELLEQLSLIGETRQFGNKQLIASRGDVDRELNIIESGAVRASNVDLDGRRVETAVLEAGDSFGEFTLLAGSPRFFDFHAHGDTCVRSISKAQFDKLMQNSTAFRDGILLMLTQRLLTAVEIIEDIRRLPLPAQLAKFLLYRCSPQVNDESHYQGTQTELADALGVSRVALGQALNVLKKQELLTTGYGYIEIPSHQKLQAWVGQHAPLHRS
ncbi:MAG: Crp/Fnr family transcriptional regulator [Spongiibacteraceae bacterium]